jgi:phosphopantetheinyl transferase (holo-ACP synthase)
VLLHGRAAARAARLGIGEVTVSISHERRMAVAVAIAERPTEG